MYRQGASWCVMVAGGEHGGRRDTGLVAGDSGPTETTGGISADDAGQSAAIAGESATVFDGPARSGGEAKESAGKVFQALDIRTAWGVRVVLYAVLPVFFQTALAPLILPRR